VTTLTGSDKVDPLLLLALGSITKAFLGELVEHGAGSGGRAGPGQALYAQGQACSGSLAARMRHMLTPKPRRTNP
jgi:hypothetical protein